MRRAPSLPESLLRMALALGVVAMLLTLGTTAPAASASGPTLSVTGYGAPGNLLTVAGVGLPLRDTVAVFFDATLVGSAPVRRISIVGDGRTSFTLQFNIPTDTTLGAHTITATDAAAGISLQSPITLKANWPMYGFGASGNRNNPYETAISAANVAQLQLAWKTDTLTGGGGVVYDAPTIADGRLYIGGGSSGPLKAYTADTGAFLWQTNLEVWPQPAYGNGRLLVGANILASVDPATGASQWYSADQSYVGDPPTIANGYVYVQAGGRLWSYRLTGCLSGQCWAVWSYDPPQHNFIGAPAVANGHVYLGAKDGYVYVLDALTGALQWRGVTIAGRIPSPVVVDGASMMLNIGNTSPYVNDNTLYVFPAAGCGQATCAPLWTAVDGAADGAQPAVANGVVYSGSLDGHLYAFTEAGCGSATCSSLWAGQAGGQIMGPPAIANGVVFVSSWQARVFLAFGAAGCGAASCAALWSYSIAPYYGAYNAPVVANGMVYFINEEPLNAIYAFHLPAGAIARCSAKRCPAGTPQRR